MRPQQRSACAQWLLAFCTSLTHACITDNVPDDPYASSDRPQTKDAGTPPPGSMLGGGPVVTPALDAGAAPMITTDAGPAVFEAGTAGPCNLSGHWLISLRTVAQGLGVQQAGLWWHYYEIEQSGSELNVKRGLVCGSEVYPVDLLAAAVEFRASFDKIAQNNSHMGRRGTVTASGASCAVSFTRAYSIVGATTPHYADPNTQLPTLEQRATGNTPGWEDWDGDGQPASSLNVSGIVAGTRYTVLRVWSDWKGTVAAGASTFKLSVPDWGQDEAILGATNDLLKMTGVPVADARLHFAQFAKLTPEQVQGDTLTVCANIRRLAPMLTPEANE
jgi:hypothetical protein